MANSVNQLVVSGNLGRDPEMVYTNNGTAITTASMAVSRSWFDEKKDEWQEQTFWLNIKTFGKPAQRFAEKFQKGDKILVVGRLDIEEYKDKEGNRKWNTLVVPTSIDNLSGRRTSDESTSSGDDEEPAGDGTAPW